MIAVWDMPEERAKARGQKRATSAAPRESAIAKQAAMDVWMRTGLPVSADDVRAEVPWLFKDLPPGKKANFMGGIWKDWIPAGSTKSRTPGSHSNRLVLWRRA
jgi:hypothetical protein